MNTQPNELIKALGDVLDFSITCLSGLDDEEFFPKLQRLREVFEQTTNPTNTLIGTTWLPVKRKSDHWKVTDVFTTHAGVSGVQITKYQGGRNSPSYISLKQLKKNFTQIQP